MTIGTHSPIVSQGFGVSGDRANIVVHGYGGSITGDIIIIRKGGGAPSRRSRYRNDQIHDKNDLENWMIKVTNKDIYNEFNKNIVFDEESYVKVKNIDVIIEEDENKKFEILEIKINKMRIIRE